ncbi:hypothetical protein BCR43DRAFT_520016 [Syncephalastrum racemosum]|uniref:Zn(2)-C6 fungal-type domain-containing protein n=1 Tax=Syncephalastrum racemosum TaxID=13706 RepID=A0A1X2HUI8_SYNRA|nr:hypothetical protein BCR43DRAFT_520016 [Syncephalastrum racemosum]
MQQYYQYPATTEPSVSASGQAYTSLTPSEVDAVTQALASAAANANTATKNNNAAPKINTTIGKRKQVKNACTNCQKACKKCDDARPCPRCVKYQLEDSCVNSVRKERKKGIKRGPYKRRQKNGGDSGSDRNDSDRKDDEQETNRQQQQHQQHQQQQPQNAASVPPFGYPSNLDQYGQPPYNTYFTYSKDQMMQHPFVVNYQLGSYPVMIGQNQQNGKEEKDNKKDTPAESSPASTPGTTSPETNEDDETTKFERLTQLCAAALNQNKSKEDQQQQSSRDD